MLFNVIPQDIFLAPVQHTGLTPHAGCRRQAPDLTFLRRLGLAPVLRRPDGCCRRPMPRDCRPNPNPKTTGCCKGPFSTKPLEKQTTVEKAIVDFRGFAPEQISVKVTDASVMVRGEQKNGNTNVQITKSVRLPEGADRRNIVCRYEDGHVTIHIPVILHKYLEESPEKFNEENEGREEQHDMDKRREAELEKSVETLADLFSSLFGLQFDESESHGEGGEEENKTREEKKCEDKTCEEETCEGEKCEEEKCEGKTCDDKCQGRKCEEKERAGEKYEAELIVKSKESEEGNCSKEKCTAEESDRCVNPVPSAPLVDEKQSLVRTTYEDKPKRHDDDGFVHVEKEEAVVVEFPNSDEEDDDSKLMTSVIDDVTKEDEEDNESTVTDDAAETPEPAESKVFKVELDLSSYKPEKIRVVFKDGDVIVEAEREIKGENYSETENIRRRLEVPENVDESKLKSYLSGEGFLTIQAPYRN